MRLLTIVPRLLASAVLLCASGAALAQTATDPQFGTPKFDGKQTINPGAVAIESTMLASTAVDAAATKIAQHVVDVGVMDVRAKNVLVIGGAENLDFSQVLMIQTEMAAIHEQLELAIPAPPSGSFQSNAVPLTAAAIIPALAGMMRSDTEYSAQAVTLDPRILPSAVAAKLGERAKLFSAAIGANGESALLSDFKALGTLAARAQRIHDQLAKVLTKNSPDQDQLVVARLLAALTRYNAFAARVTTSDKGVVPLAAAARLAQLIDKKPLILRVNTESVGGSTVKRTNLLTYFGFDGLSISGGLVASYQLTDPDSGRVTATGVVTCRTALTKLKSVQDGSWKARNRPADQPPGDVPTAVCQSIKSEPLKSGT